MIAYILMTGSLPPDVCGVGDYSGALLQSLHAEGSKTQTYYVKDWSFKTLFRHALRLRNYDSGVLNVQYPTQGYGWSIVPVLLCFLVKPRRSVITLHEFSMRSFKAKCASYLFFFIGDWFIFTTCHEQDFCCRIAPWITSRSSVIPLASNIPMKNSSVRDLDVAYFGHIRPDKGLEEFVAVVSSIRTTSTYNVTVIGQLVAGFEKYAAKVLSQLENIGARVILNKSAEDVSEILSRTKVALLPFPDGVTRRRGTALASMGNGALLVTRAATTRQPEFDDICIAVPAGSAIDSVLLTILEHYHDYDPIRLAGQQFARSFSWNAIACSYIDLLRKVDP